MTSYCLIVCVFYFANGYALPAETLSTTDISTEIRSDTPSNTSIANARGVEPCQEVNADCLQNNVLKFIDNAISIGLPSLDPLTKDKATFEYSGFKITMLNASVVGIRTCKFLSAKFDKNDLTFVAKCTFTIRGKYKASGRLLIMPINGDGDSKFKISNLLLTPTFKFHNVERDGKVFYEIKSYTVKHQWGDKITQRLTNLFKGNPELSNRVMDFINENWRVLADEFGDPVIAYLSKGIVDLLKQYFMMVPKSELFV